MLLVEGSLGRMICRISSAPTAAAAAALRPRPFHRAFHRARPLMNARWKDEAAGGAPWSGKPPRSKPQEGEWQPPVIATLPPSETWADISALSITPSTPDDLRVIQERQLGHRASTTKGVGRRCMHGQPQAFAFDPARAQLDPTVPWESRKVPDDSVLMAVESGLFRLTCPLLVQAIDEWEAEGAVNELNAEFGMPCPSGTDSAHVAPAAAPPADEAGGDGGRGELPVVAQHLLDAHRGHAAARLELLGEEKVNNYLDMVPETSASGNKLRLVLQSGITGQIPTKLDVKCLHAQVADHLCRSESNPVGALILERLEARGVATQGTPSCKNQCDLCVPKAEAQEGWWYTPVKNHWKLRKKHDRRKADKVRVLEKASAAAGFDALPDAVGWGAPGGAASESAASEAAAPKADN